MRTNPALVRRAQDAIDAAFEAASELGGIDRGKPIIHLDFTGSGEDVLRDAITAALAEVDAAARAEERERCAQIVDEAVPDHPRMGRDDGYTYGVRRSLAERIAAAIRSPTAGPKHES